MQNKERGNRAVIPSAAKYLARHHQSYRMDYSRGKDAALRRDHVRCFFRFILFVGFGCFCGVFSSLVFVNVSQVRGDMAAAEDEEFSFGCGCGVEFRGYQVCGHEEDPESN